jgi:hypothetical protein
MKNKNIWNRIYSWFIKWFYGSSYNVAEKLTVEDNSINEVEIGNNTEQEKQVKPESQFNIVLGICRFLSNTPHNFEVTFSVGSIKRNLKWLDANIDDIQLNKVLHRMRKRGVLIPVNSNKKYSRISEYKLSKKWR